MDDIDLGDHVGRDASREGRLIRGGDAVVVDVVAELEIGDVLRDGSRRLAALNAHQARGHAIDGGNVEIVGDEKQAREYLKRKRLVKPKDQKQAARIFRQLTRAGFASKTIFTILKKWEVDDETLSALEGELE